jgi:hypothetical protein
MNSAFYEFVNIISFFVQVSQEYHSKRFKKNQKSESNNTESRGACLLLFYANP